MVQRYRSSSFIGIVLAACVWSVAAPSSGASRSTEQLVTYAQVVGHLEEARVPIEQLQGYGVVAVTLAGGRIVAMSFSKEDPNLFWSNPLLKDTKLLRQSPEKLPGGFGGD